MTIYRAAVTLAAVGFAALVLWATFTAPIGKSFAAMTADPWGIVALADLYLGFLVAAGVIFLVEPRKPVALAWIVPVFLLGNVVTALWLLLSLSRISAAFRPGA